MLKLMPSMVDEDADDSVDRREKWSEADDDRTK